MKIVVAPGAFKECLTAAEVAESIVGGAPLEFPRAAAEQAMRLFRADSNLS